MSKELFDQSTPVPELLEQSERLRIVAEQAIAGSPAHELNDIVVENAVRIEQGELADADQQAQRLVKALSARALKGN